jgi:seryl-tRNA synthetase
VIDIRLARDDPGAVKAALARRGVDPGEIDRLLEADRRARHAAGLRDELRAQIRDLSRRVAESKRSGEQQAAEALAEESRTAGQGEKLAESEALAFQTEVRELLLDLPNLPAPEVPDGSGPEDNVLVRRWPEEPRSYGESQRVPHWEIGSSLGILDLDRAAKLSGSMFPLYRGAGARLIRALDTFALERHTEAFEEIRPPTLVRTETMVSTGHLPKFSDEAYHVERDDLWAIPTAEVPLTSMLRGDILDESELPIRLCASTPCFRREAGAAGRETRGVLRTHEFDKVELFAYTTGPEQSAALHAEILGRAEELLQALDLEYRVIELCTADLGNSAARTFDLEVYAPGSDQWLEVSSVSWCSDYQARRANIRYRPAAGGRPALVHTLNGSALAWSRIWPTIVEVGHQPDGSVRLPDVLDRYMAGETVIEPR